MGRPVKFDSNNKPVCEDCGGAKCGNYHISQRGADELWVGAACLSDAEIDSYPGWREKIAANLRKAA